MRKLVRVPGRLAYAFARSGAGAAVASAVITHAPWALPAARLATTREAVAFRHTRPEVRDHVVVVPRRRVGNLAALHRTGGVATLRAMILAAEAAAARLPAEERVLTVNVGVRLDVAQLHGHLLAARAARDLLAEASPFREAARDDLHALRAALDAAMERLEGGAPHVDGSLVVSGLSAPSWRLAASVAPTGRRA